MPTYILINGPPSSGKDTAAKILYNILYDNQFRDADIFVHQDKLSAPIKSAFAGTMQIPIEEDLSVLPYEAKKEAVIPLFSVSYRQWQIDFAEKFMKPLYGPDIFSKLLLQAYNNDHTNDFVVVSDCGFQHEYDYLTKHAKCFLIQLIRKGCDFSKDSREYVNGDPMSIVYNDHPLSQLKERLAILLTTRIMPYHRS